jgi:hypothetical protein
MISTGPFVGHLIIKYTFTFVQTSVLYGGKKKWAIMAAPIDCFSPVEHSPKYVTVSIYFLSIYYALNIIVHPPNCSHDVSLNSVESA